MDVGIHIPSFEWPGGPSRIAETLGDMAAAAEDGGCHSVSVMDHYFQMEAFYPVTEPMLEGYTTLGYLAARTKRVQLRLLVTGVTYRVPGLLAKIVTTVDVLSGGRAELGIGAAWYEREHEGLGVEFPPTAERFERLEEALQICLQMWSDDDGPYEGKHYRLKETLCSPKPLSKPRPAILIGGMGEKKTLALVARYADACNLFTPSLDEVRKKLDVLKGHCEEQGRPYEKVRKTILYTGQTFLKGDMGAFVSEIEAYAPLGIAEVIVMPVGDRALELVKKLGDDVVPRLAKL